MPPEPSSCLLLAPTDSDAIYPNDLGRVRARCGNHPKAPKVDGATLAETDFSGVAYTDGSCTTAWVPARRAASALVLLGADGQVRGTLTAIRAARR